jgi:hypothetical protein
MKARARFNLFLILFPCGLVVSQLQDKPDVQISTTNSPHVENSIAINPVDYKEDGTKPFMQVKKMLMIK